MSLKDMLEKSKHRLASSFVVKVQKFAETTIDFLQKTMSNSEALLCEILYTNSKI
jgi:hypothetical protein